MIAFPRLESWNNATKMVTIAATTVDKKRVLCRISIDILKDRFGASEEDPMRAVDEYRVDIQAQARKRIENEAFEEDGSILIRASDFLPGQNSSSLKQKI